MNSLQTYVNRILRHRWLVVAITVVATVGALLYTVRQPTTYTARSTLTTASESRSPDQDAYLAEAFAQYFNKESYQERIRALAQVPKDVEVSALTGATSPILYIEATGSDPAVVSRTAAQVAERFKSDVQSSANASRDQDIAGINERIKEKEALLKKLKGDSDERALILSEILDLQRQASDLRDNRTNQLIDLQRDAGVSAHQPSLVVNVILGLAGGLALGCAAALGFTALRNRITTPDDVRSLLGLPTLAVLDRAQGQHDSDRAQRLESLAAVVSLSDLPRPATIAITAPRRTSLTSHIGAAIVYYQALQGARTLLVRADLRGAGTEAATDEATVAGLLAGISTGPPKLMEIAIGAAEILVVPPGAPLGTDPFALFGHTRFQGLLRQLDGLADLIVIEAPPVNEAAESQIICAAADQSVLVVEQAVIRGSDGSRACESLTQVGASILGVVLGRPVQKWEHAEPFSTLPVPDMVNRRLSTRPLAVPQRGGAKEKDASSQPQVNPPQAQTGEIDPAHAGALAEPGVTTAPASASAPPKAVDPTDKGSQAGQLSSAEDYLSGQDDDTAPMAALEDIGEETPDVLERFDQAAESAPGDPDLQPKQGQAASQAGYLLYSDTLMTPKGDQTALDVGDPTLFAPDNAPAAEATLPPPVAPNFDTQPTLTSASPLVPVLPISVSPSETSTESKILAIDCLHGHSNPPTAANCRVCDAVIPPQRPRLVSRPVLGVLHANDGTTAEVDRAVLVGRAPDPGRSSFKAPRLMSLHSTDYDISRTHVEVAPEGWQLMATDLDSTNGTVLVHPGGHDRQGLMPGKPVSVEPGSVLELGNGVSITVGLPSDAGPAGEAGQLRRSY